MPVPKRRTKRSLLSWNALPSLMLHAIDINFWFTTARPLLLWGFAPAVVLIGLQTDPKPEWIDLINIFE
jgi:TOM7 family